MLPTVRCCPICCTGTKPACGAPGLSRPAGGDPPARTARAGLRQPPLSPSRCRGRERAREKPDQIEGARQKPALAKAGVEHPIGIIKRVFGFAKVRYRGLRKNAHRLIVTCALANLFIARRHLLRCEVA